MSYREVTMVEVKEVLRQWLAGEPKKRVAKRLSLSPRTVRRYCELAERHGMRAQEGPSSLTDARLGDLSASCYRPSTRSIPANTSSSCGFRIRPARSVRIDLSTETICDTFATESLARPVAFAFNITLPGASLHLRLLVRGTQIAVAMRLWLSESPWTTRTGRRKPGAEPTGSPRSAHQISPCITIRSPRGSYARRVR